MSTPGAFSTTFSDGETADTLASAGLADRAAIRGLDIVVLSTSDPIAAMAHYGARLGLPLVFDRAMPGGSRLQQFAVGTELLEVVHKASRNANKTKAPAKKKPTASRARDDKRLQLLTYMRPDLVKDLKIEALNNDVNAYEVVEHAVEAWLALPARSYKP